MKLEKEQPVEIYRRLLRIRIFDEAVVDLIKKGEVPGAAHTSIGQEGEIVGACMALRGSLVSILLASTSSRCGF